MMNMNNARANTSESGWVLIVAIVVMSLLLGLGLATLALTDTQQKQGRQQRVREDSFNLAEGMLYSTSQLLARHWPSQSVQAFPDCTQGSTAVLLCTDPTTVSSATGSSTPLFGGADYSASGTVKWTVQVRDNGDSSGNVLSNYTKSTADGLQRSCSVPNTTVANCAAAGGTVSSCNPTAGTFCTWDFNGDNQVFVRSEGQVRGTATTPQFKRRIVALLKLEVRTANFNTNVVTAGWIDSTNNGNNKILVDAAGTSTSASKIILTCNPSTNTTTCPDPDMTTGGTGRNQINPPNDFATNQAVSPGMTQDEYDGLQIDHTYNDTTGCPDKNSADAWKGTVLLDFASPTTVCQIASNVTINAQGAGGFLVINCGQVQMLGTSKFYGFVYGRNTCSPAYTGLVVDMGGGGQVQGGVTVDNGGGVAVGGKEYSIIYDPTSGGGGKVAGTAGLVQSTWRELTPSQ